MANKSLAQQVALVVGVVYIAIGLLGFVFTGFGYLMADHGDKFLGIVEINPFHNIFHLLVGIYLAIVSQADTSVTEGALIGGGLVFVLAFILGVTNSLQILSMDTPSVGANVLHIVTGIAALVVGLASATRTSSARSRGAYG
ncbi:MAG: DUF4383 domain-containing protein [Actinomycetota bacterium]|nr:DUF4383 domain-containing protein [Actinomycetota bacterium]